MVLSTWNDFIFLRKYILCCDLERTVVRWSAHDSLLSITVPKYLYVSTLSMFSSFILIGINSDRLEVLKSKQFLSF